MTKMCDHLQDPQDPLMSTLLGQVTPGSHLTLRGSGAQALVIALDSSTSAAAAVRVCRALAAGQCGQPPSSAALGGTTPAKADDVIAPGAAAAQKGSTAPAPAVTPQQQGGSAAVQPPQSAVQPQLGESSAPPGSVTCGAAAVACGDSVCDPWAGENCVTCPQDCAIVPIYVGNKRKGNFCCGSGVSGLGCTQGSNASICDLPNLGLACRNACPGV